MNYGHVLGLVACIGVIEMMLWAVSYEMMGIFDQDGCFDHPLVAIVNGVLFFLTLPVWVLYWIVCLGCWTVEGFRKGISSWKNRRIQNVLFHEQQQQETDDLTCLISIDDFLPAKTVNGVYYRLSDFGREVFAFVLNSDEDLKREYVELCCFDGYGLGIITSFLGCFHGTYAEICMKCDLNGLKYEDIREFFKEFIGNAPEEI